jgi:hypothetical protein
LPIGRFTELELPKEMLLVTALGLACVWYRRRDLIFVWALGTAGLMLANHQILTGLQIENYHWEYVWGPAFSFFLVLAVAEELGNRTNWSRRACTAIAVVGMTAFGVGMWIRAVESTRCEGPVQNALTIAAYRAEFQQDQLPRFEPNSVAAGATDFVDFASILDNLRPLSNWSTYLSPSVSNAELGERTALNDLILGIDRTTFETRQRHFFETFPMGPWKRNRSLVADLVNTRLAAYDRVSAAFPAALDRFSIRYVALPSGTRPDYLAQGWIPLVTGPTWDVWERARP